MTNEQKFFLHILADHLNGRKTEVRPDLDWEQLCAHAAKHEVNGIVYHQCRGAMPAPVEQRLSEKHAAELFYYFNRMALYKQMQQGLSGAEIPFFSVKGMDVAQLYPVHALRTMGDCDVVVHPEDKERAHAVMTGLGFENRLKAEIEWTYFKNGLEFELHDHLLYDIPSNDKASLESVDRAWEYAKPTQEGSRYALDWSFHFMFLLLHLKKHLISSGVGFRQFYDLAVVVRRRELDAAWLKTALEEQNLYGFAQVCSALIERWFGERLPVEPIQVDDAFAEEAAQKIFGNGIFGFHDESNKENFSLNAITQKGGPRWLVRLRNLFGSVFPPYRIMRYVPYYSFLEGRPWLLPAAWVYRFYRSVRYRKGSNGKRLIDNAFIPAARLDDRQKELARWGL